MNIFEKKNGLHDMTQFNFGPMLSMETVSLSFLKPLKLGRNVIQMVLTRFC